MLADVIGIDGSGSGLNVIEVSNLLLCLAEDLNGSSL